MPHSENQAYIVDTTRSPHAKLAPLPTTSFALSDTFWRPRVETNRTATIPAQYKLLWESKRIHNFLRVAHKADGPFEGIYFNDSDVYKWLEAASWALADHPEDEVLHPMVDEAIAIIAAAQREDGYLNTYFELERSEERWTNFDLHELYCAGHLIQAAVAHYRATGKYDLLNIAKRFADHIDTVFGTGENQRVEVPGHEEIEMALVELYRTIGDKKYLTLAQFFVDKRGENIVYRGRNNHSGEYLQDHMPFRALDTVTGHAVRMVYLDCGATDIALETGEAELLNAINRQWDVMNGRKMYVTGAIGARWEGEAFGDDYELPNKSAYGETCAAIGSLMWNWRLLLATGEARYAAIIERTLYNSILSGLSLDGASYFYQNPLADDGKHRRQAWFGCACCPPNVARLLASLTGYFASTSENALWIHQYATGDLRADLPGSNGRFSLGIGTDYPWDGAITIKINEAPSQEASLKLRIPDWTPETTIFVNGERLAHTGQPDSYAEIRRAWRSGDTIRFTLDMSVHKLAAHPLVDANIGRIALARGPMVYCVEQADNPKIDIRTLSFDSDQPLETKRRDDLLNGIVTISGHGTAQSLSSWSDSDYARPLAEVESERSAAEFTMIPYYAWANREAGAMRVWLPKNCG